jgi:hypothetical protein
VLNAEFRPASEHRINRSIALCVAEAGNDAFANQSAQSNSEDEALYADKSAISDA